MKPFNVRNLNYKKFSAFNICKLDKLEINRSLFLNLHQEISEKKQSISVKIKIIIHASLAIIDCMTENLDVDYISYNIYRVVINVFE